MDSNSILRLRSSISSPTRLSKKPVLTNVQSQFSFPPTPPTLKIIARKSELDSSLPLVLKSETTPRTTLHNRKFPSLVDFDPLLATEEHNSAPTESFSCPLGTDNHLDKKSASSGRARPSIAKKTASYLKEPLPVAPFSEDTSPPVTLIKDHLLDVLDKPMSGCKSDYHHRPRPVQKSISLGNQSPSTLKPPPYSGDINTSVETAVNNWQPLVQTNVISSEITTSRFLHPLSGSAPFSKNDSLPPLVKKSVSLGTDKGTARSTLVQKSASLDCRSMSAISAEEESNILENKLATSSKELQDEQQDGSDPGNNVQRFSIDMKHSYDDAEKSISRRKLPWQRHQSDKSLELSPRTPQQELSNQAMLLNSAPGPSTRRRLSWRRCSSVKSLGSSHNISYNASSRTEVGPPPFENQREEMHVPLSHMIRELCEVLSSQGEANRNNLTIPSLAKPSPTSFLTGREVVRSAEPSKFQLEISKLDEITLHGRLCQFIDSYRFDDLNAGVQLEDLVGVPVLKLQTISTLGRIPSSFSHLSEKHIPIVKSLLGCGADDIELVAFVQDTDACDERVGDRKEVAIFQRQSQFIVVFRGTTSQQQGKPFKSKSRKPHKQNSNCHTMVPMDSSESSIQIYEVLRESYMDLESQAFRQLDELVNQNPFCDIVFTGYSFGGTMAVLAAFRYAMAHHVVRVSCHAFGSPKIGNPAFRRLANSLPNLKVLKIEYNNDPKCQLPTDGCHIGHTVVLYHETSGQSDSTKGNQKVEKVNCPKVGVKIFKFDDGKQHIVSGRPKFSFRKILFTLPAYVAALEAALNGDVLG